MPLWHRGRGSTASTIRRTMVAATKLSATCVSFGQKTIPQRAQLGQTRTGDAARYGAVFVQQIKPFI
jgi:hypothetical protein